MLQYHLIIKQTFLRISLYLSILKMLHINTQTQSWVKTESTLGENNNCITNLTVTRICLTD